MNERILFVDDEKFVLETFRRNLRKHFEVETAEGPLAALSVMETSGPFAVVVSDLKMPKMTGVELLGAVKARWPDTVRIMLTGQAGLDAAMEAVNQGAIFRFLTKPCAPEVLLTAVKDGLAQYRLVMAEKQLLHGTLKGCIQILSELLAMASPKAFGRCERSKTLVADMVLILGLEGAWKYELAAMLSQIGCVSLPSDILERKIGGEPLSPEEERIFLMHPSIAGNLLRNIPRLESVVEMVAGQEMQLSDNPGVGARILKVALDYTDMSVRGMGAGEILARMREQPNVYDGKILAALQQILDRRGNSEIRSLEINELREGMILVKHVQSVKGTVLMEKGQTITRAALERFINFGTILGVKEPIQVLVRTSDAAPAA